MLIKTDNILIPKPGPRARRGIRDSRGMSSYDARFHQTFQCLSLNVKGLHWERDLAEHEVWLHNRRRHQVEAGVDRALERGSKLRIPRRSEVHVEEQLITCKYNRMINRYFLCLTEMRLWFIKTVLLLTLPEGCNKYKKKSNSIDKCNNLSKIQNEDWLSDLQGKAMIGLGSDKLRVPSALFLFWPQVTFRKSKKMKHKLGHFCVGAWL